MSGLFGYSTSTSTANVQTIAARIGQQLCHLAHQRAEYASPSPQLAVGRHTIGIFNASAQPVRSADGLIWLWLCGECYHQEPRRAALAQVGALPTDADDALLALRIYERQGAAGLTALAGAFVIAVWDARTTTLLIVNDRFGLYPHYYAHMGGAFVFAPEIKGVLAAPEVPRQVSETALAEYVRFQQLLGDHTWFEDVRVLPPATLLRYHPDNNRLTLEQYWHYRHIPLNARIDAREAVEEAGRLFTRAVDAMRAGPHRLGVYLSGGLDGRMILGALGGKVPVTTISFGQPGCRDVVYAGRIARRMDSEHYWFPLTDGAWVRRYAPLHLALTEGQHSWMHAHGISTLGKARTLIDVNLSGWDGGAILGGYAVVEDDAADAAYRTITNETDFVQKMYHAFCQELTWPGLTEGEALTLLDGRGNTRLRTLAFESLQTELAKTRDYPSHRRADYVINEQNLRRSFQNQIVFARAAFEVRCPFFDYDLVDFVYSLPVAIHANPQFRRAIITQRMPQLATIPYEKDDRLPHSSQLVRGAHALLQRSKGVIDRRIYPIFRQRPRLYADYEQYLRTDLRDWAEAILFDQQTLDRGLFEPTAVRALWERHLAGRELWTIGKIAPLISIELVLRAFEHNNTITVGLPSSLYHQEAYHVHSTLI